MLQKLRTICYHVEDLPKAKAWYISFTGINPYFDHPFYVGFDINGFELGLDPDMSQVAAGNHTCSYWQVSNLQETIDKAISLGATLFSPVTQVGPNMYVAVVEDPFGNHIGLITEN